MTRVIAPSRLHFGLFHVPADGKLAPGERAFGGVGLMIDSPAVVVTVKPADTWQFEGPLASRAQEFAFRFSQLPRAEQRPFQVLVEQCPAEHTGLGVGTQLALSVAKCLERASDLGGLTAMELAERVGRGERSAIGIHGFDRGGLLIENGKRASANVSPLVAQTRLPEAWRVVLFRQSGVSLWSGDRERAAFAAANRGDPEALRSLAMNSILLAAEAGDIKTFGDAVYEFNRKAGEPFAAIQGGPYASPSITELIAELRSSGIRGAGQSSWGPTVFAIVPDTDAALSLARRFESRVAVSVARVSSGHRVEVR